MSHHGGGGETAAMSAAASAGAYETLAGQARAPASGHELTQEDVSRRDEAAERLNKMDPVGKAIDFEEGVSRATVRYARGIFPFAHPGEHDLAGVSGKVVQASVGVLTERGIPLTRTNDPAELLLRVYVKGKLFAWPPKLPHEYIVRNSQASYSLH